MLLLSTVSAAKFKEQAKPKKRSFQSSFYKWARWLHVYISTATLLLVLFFSITGITLNHPDWLFGSQEITQDIEGTLPAAWLNNGEPDWLFIAETLRSEHDLSGRVSDHRNDEFEASISFSGPGYSADGFIDMETGSYTLYASAQGFVAVMNDLHKGRNTGAAWKWIIDLSAIFLIIISITGLALLLILKKLRKNGVIVMLAGSVLALVFMVIAM